MKVIGTIKTYNESRGFGFIRDEENSERFFHFTDCISLTPCRNMKVQFEIGRDKRGRPKAINVELAGGAK